MKKITQFALIALILTIISTSCSKEHELSYNEILKSSTYDNNEGSMSKVYLGLDDSIIKLDSTKIQLLNSTQQNSLKKRKKL